MTKKIFIVTIGLCIIFILLGLWIYLIFFGTPDTVEDIFSDLSVPNEISERPIVTQNQETIIEKTVDLASESLNLLTTRAVAGYIVDKSSTTTRVRYMEKGTGHIYEIDLDTGNEIRLSGVTVAGVNKALFSPYNTEEVLLYKNTDIDTAIYIGIFSSSSDPDLGTRIVQLTEGSTNATFIETNTVEYVVPTTEGSVGYEYDTITESAQEIYKIPLTQIQIVRDKTNTYVYNQISERLLGGLYKIESGQLTSVSEMGYGFIPTITTGNIIIAQLDREGSDFEIYFNDNIGTTSKSELSIVPIPDKCSTDILNGTDLWCAAPKHDMRAAYVTNWYKGINIAPDFLHRIDITNQTITSSINLQEITGYEIDVTNLQSHTLLSSLFFINRINGTLWMYRPSE